MTALGGLFCHPGDAAGTQRSGREAGFATSLAAIVLAALALYIVFKRKDWL